MSDNRNIKWAKALYDFKSQNDDEMSLKEGDYLIVTDDTDNNSGWWMGTSKDGKSAQGLFPKDYVKRCNPPESDTSKNAQPPQQKSGIKPTIRVIMLYDFDASSSDELTLKKGDIIDACQSTEEDWWEGTIQGKTGIFPKNYCKQAPSSQPQKQPTHKISSKTSSELKTQPIEKLKKTNHASTSVMSPQLVALNTGFAFGKAPIWKHPGFIGMVGDRYINGTWPPGPVAEFGSLSMSLEFLCLALDRLVKKFGDKWALRSVRSSLTVASWVCTNLPLNAGENANSFYLFLNGFVQKVRGMREGDVITFPGGWTSDASSSETESKVESDDSDDEEVEEGKQQTKRKDSKDSKDGTINDNINNESHQQQHLSQHQQQILQRGVESHLVMYILTRHADSFSFSVVNSGNPRAEAEQQLIKSENLHKRPRWDGFDYHNARLDEETGKMKRNICLSLDDIPVWRLSDSSFWFMLFRMKIWSSTKHTCKFLYETLLPYTNQRALYLNRNTYDKQTMDMKTQRDVVDGSFIHLLKTSFRACLLRLGLNHFQCKHVSLLLRQEVCDMVNNDIHQSNLHLREGDAMLIRLALKQLADNAAKRSYEKENSPTTTEHLQEIATLINKVDGRIKSLLDPLNELRLPPQLNMKNRGRKAWAACFPSFGSFRRDCSVEHLAGKSAVPPILRPVELTLVQDKVKNFDEVATALRHAVDACTLLDNQKEMIRNSYCIRVALIQHLFTEVIPLPLPRNNPRRADSCFWYSRPMRYETQKHILRLLEHLARHFVSSALSIKISRSFDASRILTMASIATIADAIVRISACDIPSVFSEHYDGQAKGPVLPFGFQIGYFVEESGFLAFMDPYLCTARTQILDYFAALKEKVRPDHVIFCFEKTMGFGVAEHKLINQLCVQMGFSRRNGLRGLAAYLTGNDPVMVDYWPEFALFRDIVFLFKSLLSPTAKSLPEINHWRATDAKLTWNLGKSISSSSSEEQKEEQQDKIDNNSKKGAEVQEGSLKRTESQGVNEGVSLQVSGFNKSKLECAGYVRTYMYDESEKSTWGSFLDLVGLGGSKQPRAPPSGANPSQLLGEKINTEDDVLHIKELPTFGNRIRARDCEILIQYLTAPYLRIPMVLQFFANQTRISSLAEPQLQGILDACLFEPGTWQCPGTIQEPKTVPAPNRRHLETPVGLLFNELQHNPKLIVDSIENMLFYAVELDVGRYSKNSSQAILYVTRLVVRVMQYIHFLIEHYQVETGALARKDIVSLTGDQSMVRGLFQRGTSDNIPYLETVFKKLRYKLDTAIYPMLEQWCEVATKNREMQLACVFHAHMAYLYLGVREIDLNKRSVQAILISYIFVTVNFRFHVELDLEKSNKKRKKVDGDSDALNLGISPTEFFSLYQKNRSKMIRWMDANPDQRDETMEAVVRVISLTGTRNLPNNENFKKARNWCYPDLPGCLGRYMPDTEVQAYENCMEKAEEVRDFEEWMRVVTTQAVDTEINIQLGEFTLKKHPMQLLSDKFVLMDDFQQVFGHLDPDMGHGIQCAEVKETQNRSWMRLIGRRHDIQLWNPDQRMNHPLVNRRPFPSGLDATEAWIAKALEPYISKDGGMLKHIDLFLPSNLFGGQSFAILTGLVKNSISAAAVGSNNINNEQNYNQIASGPTLLEVIVYQVPLTVHVFEIKEYGRRFYRSLLYSSDVSFSLGDFGEQPSLVWGKQGLKLSVGSIPATPKQRKPTLIITRNLTKELGIQEYVPVRHLKGLIPEALLDQYEFWQSLENKTITGYEKAVEHNHKGQVIKSATTLRIQIIPDGPDDTSGFCGSKAYALIQRFSMVDGQEICHTLLNALHAPSTSPLKILSHILLRLENLSHILIWTFAPVKKPDDVCTIDLVELPRVRLSFRLEESRGALKMFCQEHTGLYISSNRDSSTVKLLKGLPHAVLLENWRGELFICMAASAVPTRPMRPGSIFSTELLLDRTNVEWNGNLGDVRHYIYPIHISRAFLFTPTLSSALYLLLLRLMSRQYDLAFRLADSCVKDTPLTAEEEQIIDLLGTIALDLHPDAHACRLKLSLVSLGAQDIKMPWDLVQEMCAYAIKHRRVSASCRLSVIDELTLLEAIANKAPGRNLLRASKRNSGILLFNRRALLNAMQLTALGQKNVTSLSSRSSSDEVLVVHPDRPVPDICFDQVKDETALEDRKNASSWRSTLRAFSSLKPMSYERPEGHINGLEALLLYEDIVKGGVSIRGGKSSKGFPFLYELMTSTLLVRILDCDNCYNWACILLHLMTPKKFKKTQTMISVLRILCNNPDLVIEMPKYEDDRKYKLTIVFKGQNVIQKLLEKCNTHLRTKTAYIKWPPTSQQYPPWSPGSHVTLPLALNVKRDRAWLAPRVMDLGLNKRAYGPIGATASDGIAVGIDVNDSKYFATSPMDAIVIDTFVSENSRSSLGLQNIKMEGCKGEKLLEVDSHAVARSHIAVDLLERLRNDAKAFEAMTNEQKVKRLKK